MKKPVITSDEAANLIFNGARVGIGGFVGIAVAEEIYIAIENRFKNYGHPKDISLFFVAGQGDGGKRGLSHFAYEGLLKRTIGGHYGLSPQLQKLIANNKIEAYNFPQGTLNHILRDVAAGKKYTITKVGLNTFVDPDLEGGKLTPKTKEDLVEKVKIHNEDHLLYKNGRLDFAILRGTYADEKGNVSMEKEALTLENLSMAMAAKNSGGKVIVQVESIVENGALNPQLVKIPGILVDYVVVAQDKKNQMQTFAEDFNESYVKSNIIECGNTERYPFNLRKIIAKRAAMELDDNMKVLNFGIGLPEVIVEVMKEERISSRFTPTVEPGGIGGNAAGGLSFGASSAPEVIVDHAYQFDFYDGGGLDITFLGLAECDETGNVNVSKFGPKTAGCGGFIDISQNTQNVIFCGTFMAGKLETEIKNGQIRIIKDGKFSKFVKKVEQITFSSDFAKDHKQNVTYITERAVFKLINGVFTLVEIAPGIDLEKDILSHLDFSLNIADDLKEIDRKVFIDEAMGLLK